MCVTSVRITPISLRKNYNYLTKQKVAQSLLIGLVFGCCVGARCLLSCAPPLSYYLPFNYICEYLENCVTIITVSVCVIPCCVIYKSSNWRFIYCL